MDDSYAIIYASAAIGLIAVWPLAFIMLDAKVLDVKSVPVAWIVRACCALGIAYFVLMWSLAVVL